jgi:protein-tyrosine-phosphatase
MTLWDPTAKSEPPLVLFICRTNTAVSIMAEAILRHLAQGRIRAASAGETISGRVSAYAIACLTAHGIGTTGLRDKLWGELFGIRPPVRVLITLSNPDTYAAKASWDKENVRTVRAHWPTPDPETVVGTPTDRRLAFEEVFVTLEARIRKLLALQMDQLTDRALARELTRIGNESQATN